MILYGGNDESEMVKQLKIKFHETEEKSVKVQILTLLPMSWSIENNFKASSYMVCKANLVKSGGILSTPITQFKAMAYMMTQKF